MKKAYMISLLVGTFFSSPVMADYLEENVLDTAEAPRPFTLDAACNFAGPAKFEENEFKHDHLDFGQSFIAFSSVLCFEPQKEEGLALSAGYRATTLKWKQNPYFSQNCFREAQLAVIGFSKRLTNWEWKARIGANFDIVHFDLTDYVTYDGLLWGRYSYCADIGLNIGVIVESGMRIDHLYPIIGVDWRYNDKWQINLVYPVLMSIVYKIDCVWSVALVERTFETRHRAEKHANWSKALIEYKGAGTELAVRYDKDAFKADLHAGITEGTRVKISSRHHHQGHRYRLKGAPYIGTELSYNF